MEHFVRIRGISAPPNCKAGLKDYLVERLNPCKSETSTKKSDWVTGVLEGKSGGSKSLSVSIDEDNKKLK